jgi:hypothetical protein
MTWSGVGRDIIVLRIAAIRAFGKEAIETTSGVEMLITVEVVVAHLIDDDTHHNFRLQRYFLRKNIPEKHEGQHNL